MSKENALSLLGDVQKRLDASKSDPKWLNDALATITATVSEISEGEAPTIEAEATHMAMLLKGMMGTKPVCQLALDSSAAQIVGHMMASIPLTDIVDTSTLQRAKNASNIQHIVNMAGMAAVQLQLRSPNRLAALTEAQRKARAVSEQDRIEADTPPNEN